MKNQKNKNNRNSKGKPHGETMHETMKQQPNNKNNAKSSSKTNKTIMNNIKHMKIQEKRRTTQWQHEKLQNTPVGHA